MIEKVPVFRELTDKESVSLSVKSTKLFTLAALYDACVELLKGREKQDIVTNAGKVSIVYAAKAKKLDSIAAHLLAGDIKAVTGVRPVVTNDIAKVSGNVIIIGAVNSPLIQSLKDKINKKYNHQSSIF